MTIDLYKDFEEYSKLIVCGDIHGQFRELIYNIKRLGITDAVIIIAGDCGIGFEKPDYYTQLYNKVFKTLSRMNVQILMVRGNHDDPNYFAQRIIDFLLMKTIPDYSLVQFMGRSILCVGGAISVDRTWRKDVMSAKKNGRSLYWENEAVNFEKEKLIQISSSYKIDTVISHTAPSFCYPPQKAGIGSWLQINAELQKDLVIERQQMDKIYQFIKENNHTLKEWYYGHFHESHLEYNRNIIFNALCHKELYTLYKD